MEQDTLQSAIYFDLIMHWIYYHALLTLYSSDYAFMLRPIIFSCFMYRLYWTSLKYILLEASAY